MYCLYRLDVIVPGVTIKIESPNVDNMTTSMDDMEPFDDTRTDVPAVKMSRQDGVGVIWDKPPKDENIDSVCKFLAHADYCTHSPVSLYTDITAYLKCRVIVVLTAQSVFTHTLQFT